MLISWNITKQCNLYCKHCYRESGPDAQAGELSTREGRELLDEISAADFRLVIFSGGEPLLRADLEQLVEHAEKSGLRAVIGSNGTLIDASAADRLKAAGLSGVGISLDNIEPETHDRFRGREGAWEEAVRGIKNCLAADIPVQLNVTLTEDNYHQFDEVVDFATDLGVRAVHPFFLVPTGRGELIERDSLAGKRYHETLETIMSRQNQVDIELKPTCAPQFMPIAEKQGTDVRFTRGCLAGTAYCCILPRGEVHICPYLPVEVGNVRETPFSQLWREAEIFHRLRTMDYEGNCGRCRHVCICGGCRARAYYYSDGNYMAGDPLCPPGGME